MTEGGDVEQGIEVRHDLSTVQEETGNVEAEEEAFEASLSFRDLPNLQSQYTASTSQGDDSTDYSDAHRGPQNLASARSSSQDEYSESIDSGTDTLFDKSDKTNGDLEEEGGRRVTFPPTEMSKSNWGMARMKGRHDIAEPSYRESVRQHVQIRHTDTANAMDENARRRQRWKKTLSIRNWIKKGDDSDESEEEVKVSMHGRLMVQPSRRILKDNSAASSAGQSELEAVVEEDEDEKRRAETQYRLTTIKKKRTRRRMDVNNIPGMYEDLATGEVTDCCWLCPCPNMNADRTMAAFLHWSFRSPFVVVFGTAAVGWLSMTFVFAALIFLLGILSPQCVGGIDFTSSTDKFSDAYHLSWTTFSTVGYGLIYPSVSSNYAPIHRCTLITLLTAFESFVGVLFSSLCAALMFAKVARVQSFAQITFSDPIVIRYGEGVKPEGPDDEDDEDDEVGQSSRSTEKKTVRNDPLGLKIPCPVLEFRIFNRLSSLQGGEIIDATLNMVAVIDVSQADPALMARTRRRKKGKKKRGPTRNNKAVGLRFQRENISTLREEDPSLSEEEPDTELPERSPPSSPPPEPEPTVSTILPRPDVALRHRSVAARDAPLPHRGPAPSLTPARQSQEKTKPEEPRCHKGHHMDSRVAARRTQAQHPALAAGRVPGPRQSFTGSIIAGMPSFTGFTAGRRESLSRASFLFQPGLNHVSMRNNHNQAFEEDPSGKIIPKKMLSKLEVESPDHPFFRRIWLVRHTLDVNSLLLKPHVREMLRRNQGFWPKELNNYESIRASLEFDQILVSLSGTSNADANSVYAQHVYHMWDVNVGYRFVNALYRDPKEGTLKVDQSLINDVMEQAGGGGEPLNPDMDDAAFQEIMVL